MKKPNLNKIIADNLDKTKFQSKAQPSLPTNDWLNAYMTGGTYISDRAKATQFGQYAEGGSSWMLTNPNKISTFFPRMNNGGEPCPDGMMYSEDLDDCVPIPSTTPTAPTNNSVNNIPTSPFQNRSNRQLNAGFSLTDPKYNFDYNFSVNPETKKEMMQRASLMFPQLFKVGNNRANLNLSGTYGSENDWGTNLSTSVPITRKKNRDDKITFAGGLSKHTMSTSPNYNASLEYMGKLFGNNGPNVKINATYGKYAEGGLIGPVDKIKSNKRSKTPSQLPDQKAWLVSYIQSPMYRERLKKEFPGQNAAFITNEINQRLNNVLNEKVDYVNAIGKEPGYISGLAIPKQYEGEYYDYKEKKFLPNKWAPDPFGKGLDKKGHVYLESEYRHDAWSPSFGFETIPLHELGHAADDGGYRIPYSTKKKIYDYTQMQSTVPNYRSSGMTFDYYNTPTEFINRIQPIRYILDKKNIYDANTETFGEREYNKMMADPDIQKNVHYQDVMKSLKGNAEQKKAAFIDIMNSVAQNNQVQNNNMQYAEEGVIVTKTTTKRPDDGSDLKDFMINWNNSPMATQMLQASVDKDDPAGINSIYARKIRDQRNYLTSNAPMHHMTKEELIKEYNKNSYKGASEGLGGFARPVKSDYNTLRDFPNMFVNPGAFARYFGNNTKHDIYSRVGVFNPENFKYEVHSQDFDGDKEARYQTWIHELSHAGDYGGLFIPISDKKKMDSYAYGVGNWSPTRGKINEFGYYPLNDFQKYVAEPTETRARLMNFRYNAKNQNLYDPFTQKVTKEMLDKYKHSDNPEVMGYDPLHQLRLIYSDDEIIDLLNSVSKAEPTKGRNMDKAEYGRSLQKFYPGGTTCPPGFAPRPPYSGCYNAQGKTYDEVQAELNKKGSYNPLTNPNGVRGSNNTNLSKFVGTTTQTTQAINLANNTINTKQVGDNLVNNKTSFDNTPEGKLHTATLNYMKQYPGLSYEQASNGVKMSQASSQGQGSIRAMTKDEVNQNRIDTENENFRKSFKINMTDNEKIQSFHEDAKEKNQEIDEINSAKSAIDEGTPFTFQNGVSKTWEQMDAREKAYVTGMKTRRIGKIFPNARPDSNSTLEQIKSTLEDINPLPALSRWVAQAEEAPWWAKETDSYTPYFHAALDPAVSIALAAAGPETQMTTKSIGKNLFKNLIVPKNPYQEAIDLAEASAIGKGSHYVIDKGIKKTKKSIAKSFVPEIEKTAIVQSPKVVMPEVKSIGGIEPQIPGLAGEGPKERDQSKIIPQIIPQNKYGGWLNKYANGGDISIPDLNKYVNGGFGTTETTTINPQLATIQRLMSDTSFTNEMRNRSVPSDLDPNKNTNFDPNNPPPMDRELQRGMIKNKMVIPVWNFSTNSNKSFNDFLQSNKYKNGGWLNKYKI